MYGLVNKALEDMVKNRFGQPEWNEVRRRAGVDIEVFVSNHGYSDDITYKIVDAVCERTKLPADQVLKDFGRHWILKTARDGYGELLASGGKSVPEFLRNLPNFHARVSLIFPHLEPPRFQCTNLTPNSLDLHYHSHREGLAPFVMGLIDGIGTMLETEVRVEHTTARGVNSDHDIFRISWDGHRL